MKNWAIPGVLIIAVEYAFAFAVGARVGFRYHIPFETYMTVGLTFAGAGVSIIMVTKLAIYASHREPRPTKRLMSEIPYMSSFAVGVLLAALQISVLTWTKVMLPIASPFWADVMLANLDHTLFHTDVWIIAHQLFGWAAPLIDRAYIAWLPLKLGTFVVLLCMPESKWKSRALLSDFIMMATVALSQYLLSSAGPIFYDQLGLGLRFSSMPIEPWVATAKNYLWQDYLRSGGNIGSGISAMPSLHVAGSLWIALVWASYRRNLGPPAYCYFALIVIGSVLLGWHYAVDGIAAILIAIAAWVLAGRLLSRSSSAEPRPIRASAVRLIDV
jgi:hypothetical protein